MTDEASVPQPELEFTCFTIHEQLYALPTSSVSAIVGSTAPMELPRSPPHIPGVIAHQGRIVAVVDVAVLEGRPPIQSSKRILVVDGAGLEAGIRVSGVSEIARVASRAVGPVSATLSPPEYVVGQLERGAAVCLVVDAERLLARIQERAREVATLR